MSSRFFDDFKVGDEFVSEGITLTESGIIEFALAWDPQRFHLDVEAAKKSPYGGLIASGFHTLAAGFRMFVQMGILAESSLGSPSTDELRWLKPVRPGDTLRSRVTIRDTRVSKSKPDRGLVTAGFEVINQSDEVVMTFKTTILVARGIISPGAKISPRVLG
jgi:acyl dehydratase